MSEARGTPADHDQFITLHGVSWRDYETFLAMAGNSKAIRVTYLAGELELMASSRTREFLKKMLGRLLQAYSEELGIDLEGYGSFTVKDESVERGAEADECYVIGPRDPETVEAPEIAIEVIWTSGGIDKLEVWRKLGAAEVWFWRRGKLTFHALRGERYVAVPRSERMPDVDPSLLERCMTEPTQNAALRALRAALRAR